jgi:hypothetical protein
MHTAQRASVLLALQQTHGNRYVQRVVMGIQAKLKVGPPGDIYEQEADHMADAVMRMPEPVVQRQSEEEEELIQTKPIAEQISPLVQRQVDEEEEEEEEEEETLQAKEVPGRTHEVNHDLESRIQTLKGGGQPLPESVRAFFEPRFGRDFCQVRVHTDTQASGTAQDINARAFTVGRDIMFGAGQYSLERVEGKRLLAHELTHVVQQVGRSAPGPMIQTGLTFNESDDPSRELVHGIQGATERLQRVNDEESDEEPASTSEETATAAPGLPPEAARRLHYARTVLNRVQPLEESDEATLATVIPGSPVFLLIRDRDNQRDQLNVRTEELEHMWREAEGPPPEHGVLPSPEMIDSLSEEVDTLRAEVDRLDTMIQTILRTLNVSTEREFVNLITVEFPDLFVRRGKQIAIVELNQNEEIARREMERFTAGRGIPEDFRGLRDAAAHLVRIRGEISLLETSLSARMSEAPIAGTYQRLQIPISERWAEYEQQRSAYALQYPILLQENINPQRLASATDQQLESIVLGRVPEILRNIETTRENINNDQLKIWNLPDIVAMTKQDLGIESNSVLQEVINQHIQREQTHENILRIGIAALAITAGLIAIFASGGLALGAAVVAGAAGGYQLAESVQEFMAESAAGNVALDPDIADISQNEPELFWLVLDVACVVADAAAVGRIVRALRGPARALRESDGIIGFARSARSLPDLSAGAASRLTAKAARRIEVANGINRTVRAIGDSFRHADLEAVENAIRLLGQQAVANVVESLRRVGRIHPLNESAFRRFIPDPHNEGIADDLIRGGYLNDDGFYISGHLFVREGSLPTVQSTLIHETSHYIQEQFGGVYRSFYAEFQAYAMERRYLSRLARNAVRNDIPMPNALPDNIRWLVSASDNDIANHIVDVHRITRPSVLEGELAVEVILDWFGRFF